MSRERAIDLFRSRFGQNPEWIAEAPGRVNLIGEHTDYQEGFVMPAAIDLKIWVAASASDGPTTLVSADQEAEDQFPVSSVTPGSVTTWAKYAAGAGWALGAKTDLNAAVVSTLPAGAGLSSSAALEMAFSLIWNEVDQFGLDSQQLALSSQKAESEFVGVPCGIMDQMASAMGREGCAMHLDTRSLEIEYAPIPEGISFVVCHTGKERQLHGSEYAERREACEKASRLLKVRFLRDAELIDLKDSPLVGETMMRARHVITENDRCARFAAALKKGQTADLGLLMLGSHESLRVDFEVSCRELDEMATAAREAPGFLGARLTGAGFGGACIALVKTEMVEEFCLKAEAAYRNNVDSEPRLIVCKPSEGAFLTKF